MRILKALLLLALGVPILLSVVFTDASQEQNPTPVSDFLFEYQLPPDSQPLNIVVESPGKVWFTMPGINAIGSLVTSPLVSFSKTNMPAANSEPYDLAYDGSWIWFTERSGNKLGRLDPASGEITKEYPIPTLNSQPTGIAVAPNGEVWFAEQAGNQLARFDPVTELITEFTYNTPGALFEDLDVENNDRIWVTAPGLDEVVLYAPSTDKFFPVSVLTAPSAPSFPPSGLVIDDGGNPWITAGDRDLILRMVLGTFQFWRYWDLPTTGSALKGIAYNKMGTNHQLWYAVSSVGRVGRLTINSVGKKSHVGEAQLSQIDSNPHGVADDSNGHIWIAAQGSDTIAEWRPPYFHFTYLPLVLR